MIIKKYEGSFALKIDSEINMANIEMINALPNYITQGLTFTEVHKRTIKDIMFHYGFLIEVSGHEYSFKELANMIKEYYGLQGKNEWYYDYLMAM